MSIKEFPVPCDFDDLADWLLTVNSHFSPAELHGAIMGGLCGRMRLTPAQWAQFGLAVMGSAGADLAMMDEFEQAPVVGDCSDDRSDDRSADRSVNHAVDSTVESAESVLGGLAFEQQQSLAADETLFQPFLPDDDEPIEQRTSELSCWCKGFLGGFAEAQVFLRQAALPTAIDELPAMVQESLRDLAAIAQAAISNDSGAASADGFDEDPLTLKDDFGDSGFATALDDDEESAEEAERDYMEIVEYLRLATLTVFNEFGWVEVLSSAEKKDSVGVDAVAATGVAKLFPSDKNTMH